MTRSTLARLAALLALRLALLALAASPLRSVRADEESWAGWRGPRQNGVSRATDLPERWSPDSNVQWSTDLPGRGTSSAIVWRDRLFVTAASGPRQGELHLLCLDLPSGRRLWQADFWGAAPTLHHAVKSDMATPTPVTDGRFVYAFYGTGDLLAVDFDGRLVWQRSLADEFGPFENRFGHTSSPLLWRDLVVLQCDHYGRSYLLAVDSLSGKTRWKVDRPDTWHSWSSPRLVDSPEPDRQELIVCAAHRVDAFDPASGASLWTVGGLRRECIPTPVTGHGRLYVVSGPKGETLAIRPGGRGDVGATRVDWRSPRGAPFVPSPLLVGDYYYLVDDAGVATCLDARSGKTVWQKRLGGSFTASPVAGDGKLYFFNDDGDAFVLAANTESYRELARNRLGESVYASPSLAPGRLLVRTERRLLSLGDTPTPAVPPQTSAPKRTAP